MLVLGTIFLFCLELTFQIVLFVDQNQKEEMRKVSIDQELRDVDKNGQTKD